MSRQPDNYYRPETLTEALQLLARPETVPLGGGTKLLTGEAGTPLAGVVDLQALGLNQVQIREDKNNRQHLVIGATTRLAALSEFLTQHLHENAVTPLLQKTIRQAGPNTYRHAATFGGCIASRLPDSELLAALLVLATELTLQATEPTTLSLGSYLEPDAQPSGLITEITLPVTKGKGNNHRVARTPADTPIVSVTGWQPLAGGIRLAATGIGKRPCRLTEAESLLVNDLTDATITAAATAAKAACHHPGDFRGDADYRADMTAVLTRRALTDLKSHSR
jgi:CO/xanthine dehydrogenase FAD-binding subunit